MEPPAYMESSRTILLVKVKVMAKIWLFLCLQSDQQANQVRRLQRSNDELQQQVDSLSIQVQHLQTR